MCIRDRPHIWLFLPHDNLLSGFCLRINPAPTLSRRPLQISRSSSLASPLATRALARFRFFRNSARIARTPSVNRLAVRAKQNRNQRKTCLQCAQIHDHPDARGCLLYTSDAADERSSVDLGGRRIIKKKNDQTTCERSMKPQIVKRTQKICTQTKPDRE